MECRECHAVNDPQNRFCTECGAGLEIICQQCEFANGGNARFCGGCGNRLTPSDGQNDATSVSVSPTPPTAFARKTSIKSDSHSSGVERRQLTVMFCDLIGSTALSEAIDSEDLREVILAFQTACSSAIERYEGVVSRYMGDGVMAYFGHPQAHEDDAERALRAGFAILESVSKVDAEIGSAYKVKLAVRIGIATGPVIVGDMIGKGASEEIAAVGETPNLAARLEGLAAPNSVVVSPHTYKLVRNVFDFKDLGESSLKGFARPITIWQATGEKNVQDQFSTLNDAGLSKFVSRQWELGVFSDRWALATNGSGQLILLSGEPGMGKSRLLQVFEISISDSSCTITEFRSSPFYQNSAFYPIIDHIRRQLAFSKDEPDSEKLRKLENYLDSRSIRLNTSIPILAPLLSIPFKDHYEDLQLTPRQLQRQTIELLNSLLIPDKNEPTSLLIFEDLHWVDPSSLELIADLIRKAKSARMMIILSFRPEFKLAWENSDFTHEIVLHRLSPTEVRQLVKNIDGAEGLPVKVITHIVSKTDGIPLFIEELTKLIVESGVARGNDENGLLTMMSGVEIPTTLRDSLMARLDKLGRAKETAQTGAIIGREFSYQLLQRVVDRSTAEIDKDLDQLCHAGLLQQHGQSPQQIYVFNHALVQDTAYDSLLKGKRRHYHQLVAEVLETEFSEIGTQHPELLAHHFTQANLAKQAIDYWRRAGQHAVDRSANPEAIEHFTQGLNLIEKLPEENSRLELELKLQIELGTPLIAAKGYAAKEVETAFARARELCGEVTDAPELFRVLGGLSTYYLVRADIGNAEQLQQGCLKIASAEQNNGLLLQSHSWLGTILFYRDKKESAIQHLKETLVLYDMDLHGEFGFQYGLDPAVLSHVHLTWTHWLAGHPDKALEQQQQVRNLAETIDHQLSTIHALNFETVHYHFRGDYKLVQEKAEQQIELSSYHNFPHYVAYATIMRGSALAQLGDLESGIKEMQRGLAARRDTGAELARPLFLGLLADAYGKSGGADKGLEILAEAREILTRTNECWWEPELLRLEGELLVKSRQINNDLVGEAAAAIRSAVDMAELRGSASLVLRSLISLRRLSKLYAFPGSDEAQQALQDKFAEFTEGFDTADLELAREHSKC